MTVKVVLPLEEGQGGDVQDLWQGGDPQDCHQLHNHGDAAGGVEQPDVDADHVWRQGDVLGNFWSELPELSCTVSQSCLGLDLYEVGQGSQDHFVIWDMPDRTPRTISI